MTSPLPDAVLVARVRQRDRDAFRALFDRYYPRVYAFVQRRLGDRALAEETVADVFFETWRSMSSFRGDGTIASWMFGIAHFKCLQALRRRPREARESLPPAWSEPARAGRDRGDPERVLAAREQLRSVQRVLGTLPAGQREAVELAVLDGLDYREIAERLGVTEGTVKARISRARDLLRHRVRRAPSVGGER